MASEQYGAVSTRAQWVQDVALIDKDGVVAPEPDDVAIARDGVVAAERDDVVIARDGVVAILGKMDLRVYFTEECFCKADKKKKKPKPTLCSFIFIPDTTCHVYLDCEAPIPLPHVVLDELPVPKELECPICHKLLNDVFMISCCGAIFCLRCICTALSRNPQCPDPKCKKFSEAVFPPRYWREKVKKFLFDAAKHRQEMLSRTLTMTQPSPDNSFVQYTSQQPVVALGPRPSSPVLDIAVESVYDAISSLHTENHYSSSNHKPSLAQTPPVVQTIPNLSSKGSNNNSKPQQDSIKILYSQSCMVKEGNGRVSESVAERPEELDGREGADDEMSASPPVSESVGERPEELGGRQDADDEMSASPPVSESVGERPEELDGRQDADDEMSASLPESEYGQTRKRKHSLGTEKTAKRQKPDPELGPSPSGKWCSNYGPSTIRQGCLDEGSSWFCI